MEQINNLWYDDNGNSWSSFEDAVKYSPTLINCTNCFDCVRCTNCIDCVRCQDCLDCSSCTWCYDCKDCVHCKRCSNFYGGEYKRNNMMETVEAIRCPRCPKWLRRLCNQ